MTHEDASQSPYPLFPLLQANLSGDAAKGICGRIAKHRPVWGSPGYDKVNDLIERELDKAGLARVGRETYVHDGKHKYTDLLMPIGWECKAATLDLVAPARKRLAKFPDPPHVLRRWSSPTPVKGVAAQLVHVNGAKPEDFDGIDVHGKVVLTHNAPVDLVVGQLGALGIVSDIIPNVPNCRTRESHPDQIGFGGSALVKDQPDKGFAFNISRTMFDELAALAAKGQVKVRVKIDGKVGPTEGVNVTGLIRGSQWPDEEVVLVAHACEPGAIDNASGCAALVHVAQVLSDLIRKRDLPRPKRSIRFLFVHEFYGSAAFLHKRRNSLDKIVGAINLDHVGASQKLSPSVFQVMATPADNPSYLNTLMWDVAERLPKELAATWGGANEAYTVWRWRRCPFLPGSDHVKFNGERVPCTWLVGWPDQFYHATVDTIDKIGAFEMGRVCMLAAAGALAVANAGAAQAKRILTLVAADAEQQISATIHQTRVRLLAAADMAEGNAIRKDADKAIGALVASARKAAKSAKALARRDSLAERKAFNAMLRVCERELVDAGATAAAKIHLPLP